MKQKTWIDRLIILALALVLMGAISAAPQLKSQPGLSNLIDNPLAAEAAAQGSTGFISISAAAFQPEGSDIVYANEGSRLYPGSGELFGYFVAPVHLPHGATVTNMKFTFHDDNTEVSANIVLRRTFLGVSTDMGEITSIDEGDSSENTTSFTNPVIDNEHYAYYLRLYLNHNAAHLYEVFIEFTYPTNFLPMVMRDF